MPPLICCSPAILDQSFPKNEEELTTVAAALGEIQGYIQGDEVHLIITDGLRDLISEFDWNLRSRYPLLIDIYGLLDQWMLQRHEGLVEIDVSEVCEHCPHPVPQGCTFVGLVEIWSDEVGKILFLHDRCCPEGEFVIGIACASAFAGRAKGAYVNPDGNRCFPLIGPDDLNQIADAYEWDIPPNIHQKSVSFDDVMKNYNAIGASRVERPTSGSHFRVRFDRGRSWPLDRNFDRLPNHHLNQLTTITGYPLAVIKTALINGKLPKKVPRFAKLRT